MFIIGIYGTIGLLGMRKSADSANSAIGGGLMVSFFVVAMGNFTEKARGEPAFEGAFGTQKERYDMRRIKARKKETEILYIFFGIHAANVVHLAERIAEQEQSKAA